MKKQAIIASAAVAALGLAAQANAQTSVYISGSTAFRSQAVTAIEAAFDGGAPTNVVTRGGTDEHSATYAVISGTIGGATHSYDIYTLWSGSEAGLAALNNSTVTDTDFNGHNYELANDKCFFLLPGLTGKLSANPTSSETNTTKQIPDLAFADTSQAVALGTSKTAAYTLLGPNSDSFVGIVPFTWVKCTNSNAGFTPWNNLKNVTHDQIDIQLVAAQVAAFFTGVANDTNYMVYTVGRNKGSGTRVNTLADTGYGIGTGVDQWAVNPAATNGLHTFQPGHLVPTGAVDAAIPGYNLAEIGNAGFESGGNVSADLSIDGCSGATDPNTSNTGVICIGYLGIPDASKNSLGTNLWLTLNGVFESDDAIAQGQYSYWGEEHLYGNPSLSGAQLTYGNLLFTSVNTVLQGLPLGAGKHNPGIPLSYMQCAKGSDIGAPQHF